MNGDFLSKYKWNINKKERKIVFGKRGDRSKRRGIGEWESRKEKGGEREGIGVGRKRRELRGGERER